MSETKRLLAPNSISLTRASQFDSIEKKSENSSSTAGVNPEGFHKIFGRGVVDFFKAAAVMKVSPVHKACYPAA